MKRLTSNELHAQLQAHRTWLDSAGKSGVQLHVEDANWSGLDFTGYTLAQAILPGVCFDFANLCGVNLASTNLASASFVAANMQEANLAKATLDYAVLTDAVLRGANCLRATFVAADLQRADLTGANLVKAAFDDANLEYARFDDANMEHASLTGARVFEASLQAKGIGSVFADYIEVGATSQRARIAGAEVQAWLTRLETPRAA